MTGVMSKMYESILGSCDAMSAYLAFLRWITYTVMFKLLGEHFGTLGLLSVHMSC